MSDDAQDSQKVPTTYARLAARFPAGAHKTKTISGTALTYVDGETVVSRLNEELGLDGWSFEVKGINVLEDEVWAQGRLTIYLGDRTVIREQAGGQIINRKRGIPATPARPAQEADGDRPAIPAVAAQPAVKGDPIELSNDIKGAITDCLKKCATLAGVGLYLYDPNERREVEAEMKGDGRPKPNPTNGAPSPATTNAAAQTTQGSRAASTPSTSPASSNSSSTPATIAPSTDRVRDAALVTGADPDHKPAGYFCVECQGLVLANSSVTILKKKEGPSVQVPVADFAPVCEKRLGGFHCGGCYDKKYWKVA